MWGLLITALGMFFSQYLVRLVLKVLLSLGIGYATYTGAAFAVSSGQTYINDHFAGLPAAALAIARIAGFDQGIQMMFAAFSSFIALKVSMGAFSHWTKA